MAFAIITPAMLAAFANMPPEEFTPDVMEALEQATFFISLRTNIKSEPTYNPELAKLLKYARMDLALRLYADRMYWNVRNNPFQSETIGSYSYSKSNVAQKFLSGTGDTGILWLDLLLRYLADRDKTELVEHDGITVFEDDNIRYQDTIDGGARRAVFRPDEIAEVEGWGGVV